MLRPGTPPGERRPSSMVLQELLLQDTRQIVANLGALVERFSGKTILIAGGGGFLGRHFLRVFSYLNRHVLQNPCRVISVDNYITGDISTIGDEAGDGILPVWSDVTYPLPVREDLHYILHAAGVASPVYYMKYPLETIESAVQGTKNLLELARRNPGLEGFLFFSSSEIYGDPDPGAVPTPETYHGYVSSIGPRACYDESKRLGETISTIYHQRYGVPVSIVRPFNIFGPGMKPNDRRVIPMFTYQALNGVPVTIHGDGHQTRTFCYVTDAIAGFLRVLLLGVRGQPYNIGNSDNELSMNALGVLFTEQVPGARVVQIPYPDTYPAGEPQRRCPDLTRAKSEIGYSFSVDIKDGLSRFHAWASDQPSYWSDGVCRNSA